ncbi:MAG: hypothetical protein K2X29_02475 [Candidatus Obscuribacterales bacterium]|nr:hypothetical protein [Candidatus Obscuribacterales bacterium]
MSANQRPISKEDLFEAKESRRHDLAALPIEEKLQLLIKMQHLESEVARNAGRKHQKPWDLKQGTTPAQ